jgi:hypothetical protein
MLASITHRFTTLLLTSSRTLKTATSQHLLSTNFFNGGIGKFYIFLCLKLIHLMGLFHHSKVFPAATRPAGTAVSRNALRASQKRLQESRARQADA